MFDVRGECLNLHSSRDKHSVRRVYKSQGVKISSELKSEQVACLHKATDGRGNDVRCAKGVPLLYLVLGIRYSLQNSKIHVPCSLFKLNAFIADIPYLVFGIYFKIQKSLFRVLYSN